jgi:tetratricopeptide (TPR) repeat protein
MEILTSGWPFQQDQVRRDPQVSRDSVDRIVESLVRGKSTWEEAHTAAAQFYAQNNEQENAEKEYRLLINQIPLHVPAYISLAELYLGQSRIDDAVRVLNQSLDWNKTAFACRLLGSVALDRKDLHAGVAYLTDAVNLSQSRKDKTDNGYLLAVAQVRAGLNDEAKAQLQKVLQISPNNRAARDLLTILGK